MESGGRSAPLNRLTHTTANMDVDVNMVVAGEEKRVALFFENRRN